MKMRHFWPKCKAIALVFCPKMTKFEIAIDFDCRLKSDENEAFLAKCLIFITFQSAISSNFKFGQLWVK